MRSLRRISLMMVCCGIATVARADKVIMKDGKVYTGHIMGETNRSLLISNPTEAHPHFVQLQDVLTIVREDHAPPPSTEPQRYASVEAGLGGSFFTSRELALSPAPLLHAAGGLRLHPLIEVGADLDWMPAASGSLAISDGMHLRGYEHFWGYGGGFWGRIFPFAAKHWLIEPFVLGGFQWMRLEANGSEDYLKGHLWRLGVGGQRVLHGGLYGYAQCLYRRTRYDAVKFLSNTGDLQSAIANDDVTLSLGLSYHLQ